MNQPCVVCGRSASLQWTEHGVDEALCSVCLDRRAPQISLGQIAQALRAAKPKRDRCPYCQTTSLTVIERGLVGCSLCYEVFDDAVWRHFGITRDSWTTSLVG